MADVQILEDDRDTSLPSSALSPAEYRGFRLLVQELDHTGGPNEVSLYTLLEFLASFNGVTHSVAQRIVDVVLGTQVGDYVGEGHVYAMIRLIGHWQTDRRIEKSLIFVQARVPERLGTVPSFEPSLPSRAPTTTMLNPFRASSTSTSSATMVQPEAVDKGVEAFKRLMLSNTKEGSGSTDNAFENDRIPSGLAPPLILEEGTSLESVEQSHTGMTFVYTSDEEEDDVGSAVKHSPETHHHTELRESPQPITTPPVERRSLPPLSIPLSSPGKPAPPPSRKRGASGGNQLQPLTTDMKMEPTGGKRTLPPAPPAPRRTPSTSTSTRPPKPERTSSIRRDPPPQSTDSMIKPPPPRPRRKLSDTSVISFDSTSTPIPRSSESDPPPSTASKRISQPPPPPPPPRHSGRKVIAEALNSSPTRRSTEYPTRLNAPDSPRRSSAPESDAQKLALDLQDSELSLELGRLQREVDELVYGLTKKRTGKD